MGCNHDQSMNSMQECRNGDDHFKQHSRTMHTMLPFHGPDVRVFAPTLLRTPLQKRIVFQNEPYKYITTDMRTIRQEIC